MKNTNIALSLSDLKQKINAQCAWVDATNLATLPPIVNPTQNSEIDTEIIGAIAQICHKLSGYISSTTQEDDIYSIELNIPYSDSPKLALLAHFIEDFVLYHVLATLYEPQKQAQHITKMYRDKRECNLSSILKNFAFYA